MRDFFTVLSPVRVFLTNSQGHRRSLYDASHLVFNRDGRIAVKTVNPEQWLQPIGFPSAMRGQPWLLNHASDLGLPHWLNGEMIRVVVEVLSLCGFEIQLEGNKRMLAFDRIAADLQTSRFKEYPLKRSSLPAICTGTQVMVNRNTGHLSACFPADKTSMMAARITSPFCKDFEKDGWRRWINHLIELFALGGVFLQEKWGESDQMVILHSERFSHEENVHHQTTLSAPSTSCPC